MEKQKVIIVNGSPRKNGNTSELLKKAEEGARLAGAEVECISLYDLNYKGCVSCFTCKIKGGKMEGKCSQADDLLVVFEKIEKADTLILGSPFYFSNVTAAMRSFLERLLFQYKVYDEKGTSLFPKKIKTGFIVTTGAPELEFYKVLLNNITGSLSQTLGSSEYIFSTDTYQFDDSGRYEISGIDVVKKLEIREKQFPIDCQNAFDFGKRLAEKA